MSENIAFINFLFNILSAIALMMCRPLGIGIILPILTRAQMGSLVKGTFAFVVSLPSVPNAYYFFYGKKISLPLLFLMSSKELVVGIIIGFIIGLPLWAIQSVGAFLDTHRSATQDQMTDPGTGGQDTLTASLLATTIITLFVINGGLQFIEEINIFSYKILPFSENTIHFNVKNIDILLHFLDKLEQNCLSISAPLTLSMLLCDFSIIVLMRLSPRLHIYDLAPTLRNLVFTLSIFFYTSWFIFYSQKTLPQKTIIFNQLSILFSHE